ncbi:ThuA domain-containing protein [Lacticaseibacillus kribbianus]|uniref:ThuA domain-containing protein n=1 Tax=Lacticaseibacillus kribbianus TaxID=2926292 RepID=UPI001CD7D79F|nr:ThuA domain-containing protein [Lacticaseibacillus kribbianus]
MRKAMVVRDDFYHPRQLIDPILPDLFGPDWEVATTDTLRTALDKLDTLDLIVQFNTGRNDGDPDITNAEQARIVDRVAAGMGMMFVHAGLVLIQEDSPFYQKINSGRFISHSAQQIPLRTVAIPNVTHPILDGVAPIEAVDEHYFCAVQADKVDALMLTTSAEVTSLGAWCSSYGKGRVFSAVPGHTSFALGNAQFHRLLRNAVAWVAQERGE